MATYRKMDAGDIDSLKVVSEKIPNNYTGYLRDIQERNRRIRELRKEKEPKERAKERQEQGFSVYFSGANSKQRHHHQPAMDTTNVDAIPFSSRSSKQVSQRKAKTSDVGNRPFELSDSTFCTDQPTKRMKTAPGSSRKGWGEGNKVKIKTHGYGLLDIRADDAYSEDFDVASSHSDEDDDFLKNLPSEEERGIERVTLSFDEVRALRRSFLECDVSQMITEELEQCNLQETGLQQEADQLIEEELSNVFDSLEDGNKTIVLEFCPTPSSRPDSKTTDTTLKRLPSPPDIIMSTRVDQAKKQSLGSSVLENDRMKQIINRMVQLTAEQQAKLLDVLSNIENLDSKCVSSKSAAQSDTVATSQLKLEILSNWGHPDMVGLTELKILDHKNQIIPILKILHKSESQFLNVLHNGVSKTNKAINMWSSKFIPGQTIDLVINIPAGNSPASVIVWNYNRSLQDLDIGVRECRILHDNEVLFNGDFDKGCGNAIFDYGKSVSLSKQSHEQSSSKPPRKSFCISPRKETNNSHYKFKASPSLSFVNLNKETSISTDNNKKPNLSPDVAVNCGIQSNIPKSASDQLISAAQLYRSRDEFRKGTSSRSSRNASPSVSVATVIDAKMKSNSPRTRDLKLSRDKSPSPRMSVSKPRVDVSQVLCSTDDECLMNKLKEYKRERGDKMLHRLEGSDRKLEDRSSSSQSINSSSKQSANDITTEDGLTPMQKIQVAREKRRKMTENSLEESWNSLNLFNKCHAGRISIEIGDDILDNYLLNHGRQSGDLKDKKTESNSLISNPVTAPVRVHEDTSLSEDEFYIPELPEGDKMVINIRTSWGDPHYVGLTGVELFGENGEVINISKIEADPPDINILPGYGKDPRVVTNLIDRVNKTRDDVHMWLTPFTQKGNHFIFLTFPEKHRIAMMRIWNYNKSRIHSSRGARFVEVSLCGQFIFKGEISRACGGISGDSDAFGETILFTTNETILELVANNDDTFAVMAITSSEENHMNLETHRNRPPTADTEEKKDSARVADNLRPFTSVDYKRVTTKPAETPKFDGVYKVKYICLNFTETWGDRHYLGVTGIELVGLNGESVPLSSNMVRADPRDMTILPHCRNDARTLDKLFDAVNITTNDQHMWMVPFTDGKDHIVEILFNVPTAIRGIRIWNYNKSLEDSYRGAKLLHITSGDNMICGPKEGYLLRKAPGHSLFDFAQEILFVDNEKFSMANDYLELDNNLPCGFVYQLNLFCAWQDQYYIGLNGIEVFDYQGHKLELTENNISAYPDSVNVLGKTICDVRTPEKLIDGVNTTHDGRHMWLSPILPGIINKVFVIFDYPVALSMIRLWNYSKTPGRGVKDFSILVDDLLIYSGTLPSVLLNSRGILPNCSAPTTHWTILFSSNSPDWSRGEKHHLLRHGGDGSLEQDVMLTNDCEIVNRYSSKQQEAVADADQELRPMTSVPSSARGVAKLRRFDDKIF